MSNSNFHQIRSFGTPGSLTPNFIARAGTVGPVGEPNQNPFDVLDVHVDLVGLAVNTCTVLGPAFTPGCIVTQASLDGQRTIVPATVEAEVGYGFFNHATGGVDCTSFTGFTHAPDALPAGLLDTTNQEETNAGYNEAIVKNALIPFPPSGSDVVPVLRIEAASATAGTMRTKIVSYCP